MILLDIIATLDRFDDSDTIYCRKPWTRNSVALVTPEPESGGLPKEADRLGLHYFLEVELAKDLIASWTGNAGVTPSVEAQCDRVIAYAENDA